MKQLIGASFALLAIVMSSTIAEAQVTIQDLQRTNNTTISGRIIRIFNEDFILDDGTGQILVEADDRPLRQAKFAVGEQVTVAGHYDDDNSFEATSITREDGQVVPIFDD
jgi:uncharacterized protein YdeI (BOF family)